MDALVAVVVVLAAVAVVTLRVPGWLAVALASVALPAALLVVIIARAHLAVARTEWLLSLFGSVH